MPEQFTSDRLLELRNELVRFQTSELTEGARFPELDALSQTVNFLDRSLIKLIDAERAQDIEAWYNRGPNASDQ